MGAWGVANFENDDAQDWVYELEESKDLSVVANLDNEIYLAAPECARALAAAEVLTALLSRPSRDLTIEVKNG
jgi:Domain of unknown function (DUF4259)